MDRMGVISTKVVRSAKERGADYRLRRHDGAYRWCISSGSPRLGPGGEFLGYVGSVIDITERKEAELLLQESEERFRRAAMAVPFPIMILADDGQVVSVNRAWMDITGYTSREIPTVEAWLDRAHPAQKDAIRSRIKALYALEGATSGELEVAITTANGEQRTWLFRGAPLGKDAAGRRLVISIAHDITARKQVDDTLRESEAKFRSLADAMPQVAWTARPDGSVDYYNHRWYEICGAKEGEATGDSWVSFLHPDDRQLCMDSWCRSVLSGEPLQIEYRFWVLAARQHRWYLGRAVPVRGPSGEVEKWYGTCTDIHDQKCAEATLKEASAAPASDLAARALRILIIEDNVDAAETLQALLAMEGHQVEVALSGPAGVEAARSFLPEVILCDIGLPGGMDGYGVARALKGNPGISPSLMVALTGYGREEDRRRAQEAGFAMHLIKPIEPSSLQSLLASIAARG